MLYSDVLSKLEINLSDVFERWNLTKSSFQNLLSITSPFGDFHEFSWDHWEVEMIVVIKPLISFQHNKIPITRNEIMWVYLESIHLMTFLQLRWFISTIKTRQQFWAQMKKKNHICRFERILKYKFASSSRKEIWLGECSNSLQLFESGSWISMAKCCFCKVRL